MGWEDEGNNPEANAKREASLLKSNNAAQRKENELNKKQNQRATKKEEAVARKIDRAAAKKGKKDKASKPTKPIKPTNEENDEAVPTIENLLKEIERLRYKNETLDTAWKRSDHENGNLQMGLRRVESQLAGQQEVYDMDIGKLRKRIAAMQERVTVVTRLETGLLELCLEVRDRSADDLLLSNTSNGGGGGDAGRRHETSKRELLKRCNHDVLVVLDHLRANLRIQLAFKEDYEMELKGTLDHRKSMHVQEMTQHMEAKHQLEVLLDEAHDRVVQAEEEIEAVQDNKSRVTKECENMISEWRKKLKMYENEMNKKDGLVATLKEELKEAKLEIQNGDSKQLKIIQLENSILQQQKSSERDLGRCRVAHRNEMQSVDVQMSMLRREADLRAAAQKESASLKRDLSSYRNNVKLARFQSAELRAETAIQETNRLRTMLEATAYQLKKSKIKSSQQSEAIAKMKVEYNRLFRLAQRGDRGGGSSSNSSSNSSSSSDSGSMRSMNRETIRDLANKNSHYANFYKKKLATTKVEVKALKGITRRWMMSDHKKTAELRVTREATKRYAIEMTDLESKLNRMQKEINQSSSSTGSFPYNSEKENQTVAQNATTQSTPTIEIAADVRSLEHTNDVRDILLRANLAGLMNDDAEDSMSQRVQKDLLVKSQSTSVLRNSSNQRRRMLRPKSASMRGRSANSSSSGRKSRPQSASRNRR